MSDHPIEDSLNFLRESLSERVRIIAVSKTKSIAEIMRVYNLGQLDFGENKVQEVIWKFDKLPKDIHWHFIGHLQRNKVKYLAPFIHLIHSVDSEALLKEIDKRALQNDRIINCLIQVSIDDETGKFGIDIDELQTLLLKISEGVYPNIKVTGLMGMATNTSDSEQVRMEFRDLKNTFDDIKKDFDNEFIVMSDLSMGMTGDYPIAVKEGSNMVRIGSLIFGPRN